MVVLNSGDCAERSGRTGLTKELRAALELLYSKWEEGTPCYEDLENHVGYLGNAFKLTEEEESRILKLLREDT